MGRVFALLWAGPWSLLGLILGLTFERRRVTRGVLLCEGALWPRKLGWRYRAITFGHVVLCVDRADEALLAHELVHVRQYEVWGPLFVPAYLVAAIVAKRAGRAAYAGNIFEVTARAEDPSYPSG